MTENKKILFYRIDEQAKNVIFIITEDVENTWKEINENMQTVLSFDEIFRNITEFRNGFLNYEQSKNELIKVINCSRVEFVERMEWFDEDRLNSFNFFTRYYSNTLKDIFLSARQELVKVTAAFRNDKLLKKITGDINEKFNNIREVMRDDWNFEFNSENELQVFKFSSDKVVIREKNRNDMYTIADIALSNFFYDFSFAIHNSKLYICSCKYCGKVFFGMKNAVCCDGKECQTTYQHEQRNEKRRKKDNEPYQKHKKKLSNYIGQHKYRLSDKICNNPELVEKFDVQRTVFTKKMEDKLEEYKAENRLPDKELDDFYKKICQEIASFVYTLKDEAAQENFDSSGS